MSPQCLCAESTDPNADHDTLFQDGPLEPYLPRTRDIAISDEAHAIYEGISWGSQLHQHRLYDMISMHVRSWADINIIVAACFSGVRGYELQWCALPLSQLRSSPPLIAIFTRRPPNFGSQASPSTLVDFRVTFRQASELREFDPFAERDTLPTIATNPVLLLGTRSIDLGEDGSTLSEGDQSALSNLAIPYIETLLQYLGPAESNVTSNVSTNPARAYLLCTYLKAGY